MFSFENVSRNKEIFKFTAGLEADHCQAVFEFLDKGTCCENINFIMVNITRRLKVILKMLKLRKSKALSN